MIFTLVPELRALRCDFCFSILVSISPWFIKLEAFILLNVLKYVKLKENIPRVFNILHFRIGAAETHFVSVEKYSDIALAQNHAKIGLDVQEQYFERLATALLCTAGKFL